jgi:hypothetical protein
MAGVRAAGPGAGRFDLQVGMARVAPRAARRARRIPGTFTGNPRPVSWSAADRQYTRTTACRDELASTITTVRLGVNVPRADRGGGVRHASAAPASARAPGGASACIGVGRAGSERRC